MKYLFIVVLTTLIWSCSDTHTGDSDTSSDTDADTDTETDTDAPYWEFLKKIHLV